MDNIAGPPVEGDNFFGREGDIERLWGLLSHHDILLLGPRRIGKTSVARAVMVRARTAGWDTVEVNVASGTGEAAFLDKLTQAVKTEGASLADRALDWLREGFDDIEKRIKSVRIPLPDGGSLV